jgi:MazG family protein
MLTEATQVDANKLQGLLDIMARLRAQCPWDIKQTPHSLSKYAIEEAYELDQAIHTNMRSSAVADELGDVLLQVVFMAQMYSEQGQFDFNDVVATLSSKLIRRHPHVFDHANFSAKTPEQVALLWQSIKLQEKAELAEDAATEHLLERVKWQQPLAYAQQLQCKAATVGFDWGTASQAFAKLKEEIGELEVEINAASDGSNKARMQDELGDCIFSLINVARKLELSGTAALESTSTKFKQRFAFIEAQLARQGLTPSDVDLATMDALWELAKKQ